MQWENEPEYRKTLKTLIYQVARCCPVKPGNATEAAEICRLLYLNNLTCTLGKLSKAGEECAQIVEEYKVAGNSLGSIGAGDRFYLSVKPPAIGFDLELASEIVATARVNGQGVHFDAHAAAYADATLRLLEDTMKRHPAPRDSATAWSFGVTLPARWKRSRADARWVVDKAVRPRVVKGDFKAPASDETDPVEGFLELIDMLAGKVAEIAVATHDCKLAREAVGRCRRGGSAVQLELFFGMPSGTMMALAREMEVPVRFYVPFGDTLLIYLVRDLLTNPHKILRRGAYEVIGSRETKLSRIIGALPLENCSPVP